DDPVYEARLEAIRSQGGNPFRDEQLPQAVIALKQGVGRLIRSESDRGVLVLCTPPAQPGLRPGFPRFTATVPPYPQPGR
ncbi:helicase C-terminal domain-containing protein, partial [Anaerococcus lactolyticus]|uniref:helicase C-terminal domain-containing protein n=1 Tax=Anaerococcus lactolyticus TaxID=33032 RepID=UPI0024A6DE83